MRRSLVRQSLHYLARPHGSIRRTPIGGPAAWRRDSIGEWRERLDAAEIDDIESALARTAGRPAASLRALDIPLPRLEPRLRRWRRELLDGRGFVVVGGLPVGRWSESERERFFWGLGLHLGVPGAQNPAGELLGHVRDTGEAPGAVRQYRTREAIPFHCDLADVVGLLSLAKAARGGQSRIASAVATYDALLARDPALVDDLYAPFLLDTRGEGGVDAIPIDPCAHFEGRLSFFWHASYFRSVERLGVHLDTRRRALLDRVDEILDAGAIDMDLEPGDVQLLSNHVVVHARSAFEDDPRAPRHLLRLWLSLDRPGSWAARLARERSRTRMIGRLAQARLQRRRRP